MNRQSHSFESGSRLTHFGFFLEVKLVDLLQLTFQSEEESGLVRLQGGLRVLESGAICERLLGGKDWSFAQVLNELWGEVVSEDRGSCDQLNLAQTFLRAL